MGDLHGSLDQAETETHHSTISPLPPWRRRNLHGKLNPSPVGLPLPFLPLCLHKMRSHSLFQSGRSKKGPPTQTDILPSPVSLSGGGGGGGAHTHAHSPFPLSLSPMRARERSVNPERKRRATEAFSLFSLSYSPPFFPAFSPPPSSLQTRRIRTLF